tara:strand:- start:70 stop:450 length:381 start_codon:yes stop_codon:yes gene_type:complete
MTTEDFEDFLDSLTTKEVSTLREFLKEKEEQEMTNKETTPETVSEDFMVNRSSAKKSRAPVQAKENTWSDNGESKEIETPEFEKTPRNRPKPKVRVVNCHVCGKSNKISPELVYGEFYRCDKCIGR